MSDAYENWQEGRRVAAEQRLAELEREVHDLINMERSRRGLAPAAWSERMHSLAKDQSDKMAQQDRIFHSNRYALEGGENAWTGSGHSWSAEDMVESWMDSAPHRAWILGPRVSLAAVGVSYSDDNTYAAWAFSG